MAGKLIRCLGLGAAAVVCGGCVLDDIHDQMQLSHAAMLRAESTISASSASLTRLEGQLDSVLEQNLALQAKLADQQVVLTSIDGSLRRLDEHLLALRQMIDAIDDRIPFVSFGSEGAPTPEVGAEPAPLPLDSDGLPTVRVAPSTPPPQDAQPPDARPSEGGKPAPDQR